MNVSSKIIINRVISMFTQHQLTFKLWKNNEITFGDLYDLLTPDLGIGSGWTDWFFNQRNNLLPDGEDGSFYKSLFEPDAIMKHLGGREMLSEQEINYIKQNYSF